MRFSLANEIKAVDQANTKLIAAKALDSHLTQKAKVDTVSLISSPKGMAAIFLSGVVKGAIGPKSTGSSSVVSSLAKHVVTPWLSKSNED